MARCATCGAELPTQATLCPECGSPNLAVTSDLRSFSDAQARAAQVLTDYRTGKLDAEGYRSALQRLVVRDEQGGHWLPTASGEWLHFDGKNWVRKPPPFEAVQQPSQTPFPPQGGAGPPPASTLALDPDLDPFNLAYQDVRSAPPSPPRRRKRGWVWALAAVLGLGGIGVVVVAALVVIPRLGRSPGVPVTPGGSAPPIVPTDVPTAPTEIELLAGESLIAALGQVAEGGTLWLSAGEFVVDTPLRISRPITLIGQGSDVTRIVFTSGAFGLEVLGGAFEARGITFHHTGAAPVNTVVLRDAQAAFEDCAFSGAKTEDENRPQSALRIGGNARATIHRSRADGNQAQGIRIEDDAHAVITESSASDNRWSGIVFVGRSAGEVKQSEASGSGSHGILLDQNSNVLVENCHVERNAFAGIIVRGQAVATLRYNLLSNNLESGIFYRDQAGGEFYGNTCNENGLHGVEIRDEASPNLRDNTCERNTQAGIRISGSSQVLVENNTFQYNTLSGIIVLETAQPILRGNLCSFNQESGIAYFGTAGGLVTGNTCNGNTLDGMSLRDQVNPVVENNVTNDNANVGIGFYEQARGTITGNECLRNQWGLYISAEANPALSGNVCRDNSLTDIDDRRP